MNVDSGLEVSGLTVSRTTELVDAVKVIEWDHLAIAGPGSTNLLTGLYDAKVDRAPVVSLSGQVPPKYWDAALSKIST